MPAQGLLPLLQFDPDSLLVKELLSLSPEQAVSEFMVSTPGMPLRAIELFAGVGGFHLGLEGAGIEVVWANQWEPGRKQQHAFNCYKAHFPETQASNEDVSTVPGSKIPRHHLLVGGFPCQDYSVATTKATGIQGKKGVLWWEIHRILTSKKPAYLLLENVDRLLKSPTKQRGRDFGVMLRCLADLGYRVEWRVLNAADYGNPQKRRRVFLFGAHRSTPLGAEMGEAADRRLWLQKAGFFASAFPVARDAVRPLGPQPPNTVLDKDLQKISDRFAHEFQNSGIMVDGKVWTAQAKPKIEPLVPLSSLLERDVAEDYFVPEDDVKRWKYLKGAKAEERRAANGHVYHYSEGPIPFPDRIDQPSRTLITSGGGISPSRFKHLIEDPQQKRLRVLTPTECERLNGFPAAWTERMPQNWRYFCMGNALVVGLIKRVGDELVRRTSASTVQVKGVRAAARRT